VRAGDVVEDQPAHVVEPEVVEVGEALELNAKRAGVAELGGRDDLIGCDDYRLS